MTKKETDFIAKALHGARPIESLTEQYKGWKRTAETMAKSLKEQNPLFDMERFMSIAVRGVQRFTA